MDNIKAEIHKVVDRIPDDLSEDVLNYLKGILAKSSISVKISTNLSKILSEDIKLLNRLAR